MIGTPVRQAGHRATARTASGLHTEVVFAFTRAKAPSAAFSGSTRAIALISMSASLSRCEAGLTALQPKALARKRGRKAQVWVGFLIDYSGLETGQSGACTWRDCTSIPGTVRNVSRTGGGPEAQVAKGQKGPGSIPSTL